MQQSDNSIKFARGLDNWEIMTFESTNDMSHLRRNIVTRRWVSGVVGKGHGLSQPPTDETIYSLPQNKKMSLIGTYSAGPALWPLNTQFFHAGSQRADRHPQNGRGAVLTTDIPICVSQHLEEVFIFHFRK